MHSDHAEELLAALRDCGQEDLPFYTDCVRNSFANVEPVFARGRYTDFFWHCASTVPGWVGHVVLANSAAESQGSAKLFNLWRSVDYNSDVEKDLLNHA